MNHVIISHVSKRFKDNIVIDDLNLEIPEGSFTVLLGPSGCGKTTLLRIIAGLEEADQGDIQIGQKSILHQEAKSRGVAMVFQNYALYPHMNVFQNVEYCLKIRRIQKEKRKEMVQRALEDVELTEHASKMPAQLSGGQRQRVALARALVKTPDVYLMDEPLSNLDAKLRNQMRERITALHRRVGTTFIYVTHDQVEAMSMGTNIVLFHNGRVVQQGTPKEIYMNPQNVFAAGFIGSPPANILTLPGLTFAIRPEHVRIRDEAPSGEEICVHGDVLSFEQLGDGTIYHLQTVLGAFKVKTSCNWDGISSTAFLVLPENTLFFFDENGDRILGVQQEKTALETLRQYLKQANRPDTTVPVLHQNKIMNGD